MNIFVCVKKLIWVYWEVYYLIYFFKKILNYYENFESVYINETVEYFFCKTLIHTPIIYFTSHFLSFFEFPINLPTLGKMKNNFNFIFYYILQINKQYHLNKVKEQECKITCKMVYKSTIVKVWFKKLISLS